MASGKELMKYAKNDGTIDNCHPNDLGFYKMAKAVCPVLQKAFRKKGIL